MLYRGQMGSSPHSFLFNLKNTLQGKMPPFRMPANTNSFFWGNKILACYETGLPHVLDPATLRTLCAEDFNGLLRMKAFSAHFRYDATIDRLVCMSHRPGLHTAAKLGMYEFDRHWNCTHKLETQIEGLNYAHDFLLSKNFYILHKSPFVKVDKKLVTMIGLGLTSPGQAMQYYKDLPSQIVLIPRNGTGAPILFDTDPCHIYHFGNVLEHDTTVTFNAVCIPPGMKMEFQYNLWLSNTDIDFMEPSHPILLSKPSSNLKFKYAITFFDVGQSAQGFSPWKSNCTKHLIYSFLSIILNLSEI